MQDVSIGLVEANVWYPNSVKRRREQTDKCHCGFMGIATNSIPK